MERTGNWIIWNDYTPNGVVVVVVATVVKAVLAVAVKVDMLLLFHIVFQKYCFLVTKKVLGVFLWKSQQYVM